MLRTLQGRLLVILVSLFLAVAAWTSAVVVTANFFANEENTIELEMLDNSETPGAE